MRGTVQERLLAKLKLEGETKCWVFIGCVTQQGYGRLGIGGRRDGTRFAHRVSYELFVGPIPEGLTLDHLCRNRACVNPAHLEPVTQGENTLRGESPPAQNARKTHCAHNHPYDDANTRIDRRGWRKCRACDAALHREIRRRAAA